MSEWIPVKEKEPENLQYVLVYLEKPLKYGRRVAFSTFFKGEFNDINGSVWPGMPKPTHWMPLPEPPSN